MKLNTEVKSDRDYVRNVECSSTGQVMAHDRMHGLSEVGAPLLVRYDLETIGARVDRDGIAARPGNMWMWRELLPIPPEAVIATLGEGFTPLFPSATRECDESTALIKDEGRLPTGSFKARGMAVAVSMAKHFGKSVLAIPTAGNAGAAAAAYGAAAGLSVKVFTPVDTPDVTVREMAFHGAQVFQVDGLIDACGAAVRDAVAKHGWHDLSTLAEPYRLEGKKTIGLELARQFNWSLPDVIYYPTGGGTGFIGMWKAFSELQSLGWIDCTLPRMVSVQTLGCNPIKEAFEQDLDDVPAPWSPVTTVVPGVRVPKPLGGRLILQVIRESGGHAGAVSDEAAFSIRTKIASERGINLSPEGAVCLAAYEDDLAAGRIHKDERAVVFNTATGFKWPMPQVTS